jgi:hypothetical protein
MALEELTIKVHVDWRLTDPDDDVQCLGCGDTVFTPFRQLWVRICDEPAHKVERHRICQSCYDEIRRQ